LKFSPPTTCGPVIDRSKIGVQSDSMKKLLFVSSVAALSAAFLLLVFSFALLAEPRLDPAISLAKRELLKTLKARNDKTGLREVGTKFAAIHGIELTRMTLLQLWKEETQNAPLERMGNQVWLMGEPQVVQDIAWLFHFEDDWAKPPARLRMTRVEPPMPPMPPMPTPLPMADELHRARAKAEAAAATTNDNVLLPTGSRTNVFGEVDLLFDLPDDWNNGYTIQRREAQDANWQYIATLEWSKGGQTDAVGLGNRTAQFRLVKR